MLDYQPAKIFRRQIIRRKFVLLEEPGLAPVIGIRDSALAILATVGTFQTSSKTLQEGGSLIYARKLAALTPRQQQGRINLS